MITRVAMTRMGDAGALLIAEFKEAWNHYRHIESSRNTHMGFYFAAMVAIFGICANLLKSNGPADAFNVGAAVALLVLLDIHAMITYLAVRKADAVLEHYERVLGRIRDLVYEDPGSMKLIFDIRRCPRFGARNKGRIQRAYELFVAASSVFVTTAYLTIPYLYWKRAVLCPYYVVIIGLAVLALKVWIWVLAHPRAPDPIRLEVMAPSSPRADSPPGELSATDSGATHPSSPVI